MKRVVGTLIGALILGVTASEASMNDQTLDADILDPRVTSCGVKLSGDSLVAIRPFIETSITGRFTIKVLAKSGSNTNVTQQSVGFPGNSVIQIGRPTSLRIEMIASAEGKEICRLEADVKMDGTIKT